MLLDLGAGVEEACPFGRQQPLVTVAGVEIGTERLEIEGQLPGGVGAVDDGEDAGLAGAPAQRPDR